MAQKLRTSLVFMEFPTLSHLAVAFVPYKKQGFPILQMRKPRL